VHYAQIATPHIHHKKQQEYRATGTDDCYRNCTLTLHETVQNSANACEVHGRNKAPNKNINPAVVRGYASQCDALPKVGSGDLTPSIDSLNRNETRHSPCCNAARMFASNMHSRETTRAQ